MAICKLNRNLLRSTNCGYSLPEIVDIYLVNHEDISGGSPSFSSDTETGCEAITGISWASDAAVVAHIEPAKNSASFSDALATGTTGNKYRVHTLTFSVVGNYDDCMHGSLDALSLGRYFAMVKTAEGSYLGLGRLSPLEAETAELAGGGDSNGIQVVLTGNVAESVMPITETAVNAILAKVPQA